MAINEQIVTGRAHRVLIDKAAKLWQRISFWTKASDVEFNDKKTAETKVGAIDGITDSLASTSSRIAASAKSVNKLNNDLVSNIYVNDDGKLTVTKGGADTVLPFKGVPTFILSESHITSYTKTINCSVGDIFIITVFTYSNGQNQQVSVSNATTQYDKTPTVSKQQMREMIVAATSTSIIIKITVSDGWGGITVSKM